MASITKEDLEKEAFSANLIYRLLKNQRFVLTGRLREFFHLFQVPEVRQSIFVKIIELKFIFEDEIKEYFKADEKNENVNIAAGYPTGAPEKQ
ncbi:MAG: hypothetical protein NT166_12795 [Candidatus Aminicenantes bacterium]|nr:hypothetical protein [Candidatus Aminicenantes bacterium]